MDPKRWQRISSLYDATLARPKTDRAAFLEEACAGDEELRRQMDALLAAPATAEEPLAALAMAARMVSNPAGSGLTGRRVGVYQVQEQIGAGGMGEIYRARDTRLRRDVAIKILPRVFTDDPDRLVRFEREARVLAALNHPNIATIYGLEETDLSGPVDAGHPARALVMELVDGETLAGRLAAGPLRVADAVVAATQLADALDAAHEKGIVHRDLKPANIKIRPDGTIKVLDFGLARVMSGDGTDSKAPTVTLDRTGEGVIAGTAAYMSPEQARGLGVDKRTDIWAFGCVLYELLTGRATFARNTVADTLGAVVSAEPDWALLPESTPASVRRLLRRCLDKNSKQRLRDIGDARLELREALAPADQFPVRSDIETGVAGNVVDVRPVWRRLLPLVAVAMVTSIVIGLVSWTLWPAGEPPGVARFDHVLADAQTLGGARSIVQLLTVSPDDRYFVYSTDAGFYVRTTAELEARLIPGTEGPIFNPVISPDGESVSYFRLDDVRRVAISGGTPVVIAKVEGVGRGGFHGASWGVDNTILFSRAAGIWRVSANGGTPELVISAKEGEAIGSPRLLPDGESVLFSVTMATGPGRWDQAAIAVQSLRTGERKVVLRGGSDARYVPTGHLVYAVGDTLFAVAFDLDGLTVRGRPIPVVQGVQRSTAPGTFSDTANYGVSDRGRLVYWASGSIVRPGLIGSLRTLVWVSRTGREEALAAPPRPYSYPRLSPDGMQVAVDVRDTESGIWVWSITRATLTRLTFGGEFDRFPIWSPDGRRIAFTSQRDGSPGVFWQTADGTGQAERLVEQRDRQVFPISFAPDGTRLVVYGDVTGTGQDDVHVVSLKSDRAAFTPLFETMFNERNPEVSPNGRWLAYEADESGELEVYVRPFPDINGGRWQVSTGGGAQPAWARNGRELFYRNGDTLMSVPIEPGAGFTAAAPVVLFKGQYAPSLGGRNYDVSPDGQRFLLLKVGASGADSQDRRPARFIIVENWHEELKRLVPGN